MRICKNPNDPFAPGEDAIVIDYEDVKSAGLPILEITTIDGEVSTFEPIDCRLNVDDTGFVVERDPYWWNEDGYVTSTYAPTYNYTFKYPDYEDSTSEQIDYIGKFMLDYEASILEGTYPDLIDVESFATWLLDHDILGTRDSGGSNMYFTKFDNTSDSKLMLANMWDFDTIESSPDQWSRVHSNTFAPYIYPTNSNPAFRDAYLAKWEELKDTVFTSMINFLNEYAASEQADAYDASGKLDSALWGLHNFPVKFHSDASIAWYTSRKPWMEENMSAVASVSNIAADYSRLKVNVDGRSLNISGLENGTQVMVYDIQGHLLYGGMDQQIECPSQGVYIVSAGGAHCKVAVK